MSVPGLNGVGPDIATAIRLAQGAAPAAPQASDGSASSAPNPPQDKAAQAALNELLNDAAPSDASIGLYSAAPDTTALDAEQAARAADVQAADMLQRNLLLQAVASDALARATLAADQSLRRNEAAVVQQSGTALADIENSLNAALAEAKQTAFAADLQNLLQAVEAGAAEVATALADKLQAAQGEAEALDLAASSAGLPQAETAAALPALVENLIATTQSGDMTGAALFAQAIRMQMNEAPAALPPGWLAALAAARGAILAPPPDVGADPLLQAYQASLLIGVRRTLNKLRRLREDRMRLLPILALGQSEQREDE